MYGGSTDLILVNLPGESSSVMTSFDGYQMGQHGRAGAALGISAIGSFIAGTLSVLGLMLLAPPLAAFAIRFGPPEYFSLMALGMTLVISLVGDSMIKGLLSRGLGIFLGTIGMDPTTGIERFSYGIPTLLDGLSFVSVSVGLFALSEVFEMAEYSSKVPVYVEKIRTCCLTRRTGNGRSCRSSGGAPSASLPVACPVRVPPWPRCWPMNGEKDLQAPREIRYGDHRRGRRSRERQQRRHRRRHDPAARPGRSGVGTAAIMMGALLVHGMRPGPLLLEKHPDFFWAVIASMYIGNVMLLILNLPFVGVWARMLKIPHAILIPLILAISSVGVFTVNNNLVEVWIMLFFGIIGYFMKKFGFPAAPVILALILTPLMENALQQSLQMSHQELSIFFNRPISLILLCVAGLSLFSPLIGICCPRHGLLPNCHCGSVNGPSLLPVCVGPMVVVEIPYPFRQGQGGLREIEEGSTSNPRQKGGIR